MRAVFLVAVAGVMLAACEENDDTNSTATPTVSADRLPGTAWVLVEIHGQPVLQGVEATLEFSDDGRIGGYNSCNHFGGSVHLDGNRMGVSDMMQTLIGCQEDVSAQENAYMAALREAERWEIDGEHLLIYSAGEDAPLRFRPGDSQPGTPTPEPGTGPWETLPPLALGPRQETAVVTLGDEIVVIGGFGTSPAAQTRVEAYYPATRQWRRLPDLPVGMHHTNAAVVDGSIYIVGFLTGNEFRPDGRVFVLRPGADQWGAGAMMPAGSERGSSVTVAIGQRIYVAGGLRGGAVADFSVYDTATDTWSGLPDLPLRRDHFAGGAFGERIVLAGGREGSIGSVTGRVDIFDTTTNEWSEGAPMPTPRGGTAGAVLDGRLYVFGGEGNRADPSGVFPQAQAYDVGSDSWVQLPDMPVPRHGTGAAALGGTIYVPGGATVQAFGAVDDFEAFTPQP